ncbi:MAG: hypothetical protein IPL90_13870 [Holophagales bacterium]|nr:hypothetical protein [Holophagales bacterium]
MFVGHFGVGFAGKAVAPRASLGTLFLAGQFIDLLWPTLLLLGLERVEIRPGITRVTPLDFVSYPISHGLLSVGIWGLLFAGVYQLARRYAVGTATMLVAVVSHWFLDLLTHRPDLPLSPWSATKVGLGLWDSLPATLLVELAIFGGGLILYLRATKAVDRTGSIALWGLVGFLLLIYAANLFGSTPPGVKAIAWAGHAQWLLVAWAYWVDRHRTLSVATESPA